MRKSTKIVVAVAALVVLCSFAAMAKTGWANEDGQWFYYGTDGEKVSDTWKVSGGKWYWLGEDYAMLTNQLVDDDNYYVGEDGARVVNAWIALPATEEDESGAEYRWYWCGSGGKIFKADATTWQKKINGKYYAFDEEGKMMFGFIKDGAMINDQEDAILDAEYYFAGNEDGSRQAGWVQWTEGFVNNDTENAWFYFKNGKKITANDMDADGKYLINKKYYTFDENGIMKTSWYAATGSATESFWNEDGSQKKSGWVWTTKEGVCDEEEWFYLSSGVPVENTTKYIKKKWYVLAEDGVMKAGLVRLDKNTIEDAKFVEALGSKTAAQIKAGDDNIYFFSADKVNDGSAKSGTIQIDLADDTYTFAFDKHTFKAIHGLDTTTKVLYDHGMLQAAGSSKYAVKTVDGTKYFVDANGKEVVKTGKYMDADETYFIVNGADGKIAYQVKYGEYKYTKNGEDKWATSSKVASAIYSYVKSGTWTLTDEATKDAFIAQFKYTY